MNQTDHIGFIGMGAMGFPIACGLHRAGYQMLLPTYRPCYLRGFSPLAPDSKRKKALLEEMLRQGAKAMESQSALIAASDILLLSLPTSTQVEEVMYASDGILAHMKPGGIVIDLTSSDPESTRKLAAELEAKDICLLDAPVSGGPVGASAQTLSVMVGGRREIFERCLPIFHALGSAEKVYYMGPSGAGDTIKCANNFLSSCCFAATAEALTVCARAGIDPRDAVRVINNSGGASNATSSKFPNLIFPGKNMGMSVELMRKDIRLFLETARKYDVPAFFGSTDYQIYNLPVAQGEGKTDFQCLIGLYEQWASVKLRGIAEDK